MLKKCQEIKKAAPKEPPFILHSNLYTLLGQINRLAKRGVGRGKTRYGYAEG